MLLSVTTEGKESLLLGDCNVNYLVKELFNLSWRIPKNFASRTETIFKFRFVSVSEVHGILKSLRYSKSVGVDNLPSRLLKDSALTIAPPLTYIINLSLESGLVPTEWKSAKIVPIHKTGSRSIMDNYRPISILPTISKVLERVIYLTINCYQSISTVSGLKCLLNWHLLS